MPPRLPDNVERWPVDRLLPYIANARSHPEAQVAQIAGSIAEFGFNVPCLVDERGVLIAGHGRLLAAKRLGLAEIPVIRLGHLTGAQARAFRIADNQIALNAGWDDTVLAAELARLREDGVDLDLLGFGEDDLDRLLDGLDGDGEGGQTDEDEVPEPPAEPVTRPGDLWVLGRHRLLCGDATNGAGVARLLDGAMPHLLIQRPALRRRIRPVLAQRGVHLGDRTHRQGCERRPRRLARGLGPVPRRRRLCLACWCARQDSRRKPGGGGIPGPVADHLVEATLRARARRLPLAA